MVLPNSEHQHVSTPVGAPGNNPLFTGDVGRVPPRRRVISAPEQFNVDDLYVDLAPVFGRTLHLKCEGFNFAGSVKLRAAIEMVEAAERSGDLRPGSILVESSSGNLGIALSMLAASRGYGFLCVTDSRCNHASRRAMEAFGAEVKVITEPDPIGGFLGARINFVQALCASDFRYVWLNQYANQNNWLAHYRRTGAAILTQFPDLDVLFVGAGTTGTLMGCARYLRERKPSVSVVAVDAVGSVTFGGPPQKRLIPGLGTSVQPPQLDASLVDDVIYVAETDTVAACRAMARRGFLFGGSTGTVVHGALTWLAWNRPVGAVCAVAIAPDLGERYLDSVYHDGWVRENFDIDPAEFGYGSLSGLHLADGDESPLAIGQPS